MSETKQIEKSLLNHISTLEKERYKEQIDDCLVKLELPTAVTLNASQNNLSFTNKEHPLNSKQNL